MKQPLLAVTILTFFLLFASCGRVERPKEFFNFTEDSADKSQLNKVNKTIGDLEGDIEAINARIDAIVDRLNNLYSQVGDQSVDQDALTQAIALQQLSITQLESHESVTNIIDPCGDDVGHFDEVLLITATGKIIAYFEQGNKRFLSILPNGNFRTTDHQRCNFSVVNGVYVD